MKRLSLLILFLVCFQLMNAQNLIYRTYEDYVNNKGEDFGEYDGWKNVGSNYTYTFIKNNEKIKIPGTNLWGFKYRDALFRVEPVSKISYLVYNVGKLVYYENGGAHVRMMQKNETKDEATTGWVAAVSKDLNSKFLFSSKDYKEFVKAYPELSGYAYSIGTDVEKNREVVKKYEGK